MASVDGLEIRMRDGGASLEVYVKPRASRTRIIGTRGTTLEVALAAPPVDGAANDELVRCLAERLALPRSALAIVRGQAARQKLVTIVGLRPEEIRARLSE